MTTEGIKESFISFGEIQAGPEIFYPNMEKDADWTLKPIILSFKIKVIEQQEKRQLERINGETLALQHQTVFPTGQILAQILVQAGEQIPDELVDIPIYFPDLVWINKNEEGEKEMSPFIFCSCKKTREWSLKYYDTKEYLPPKFAVVEEVSAPPIHSII
jgi:hypothetical protein